MPIDRGGKHWCAPSQETPDADKKWTCPCGKVWLLESATWKQVES